jgi:hypothetical protein
MAEKIFINSQIILEVAALLGIFFALAVLSIRIRMSEDRVASLEKGVDNDLARIERIENKLQIDIENDAGPEHYVGRLWPTGKAKDPE